MRIHYVTLEEEEDFFKVYAEFNGEEYRIEGAYGKVEDDSSNESIEYFEIGTIYNVQWKHEDFKKSVFPQYLPIFNTLCLKFNMVDKLEELFNYINVYESKIEAKMFSLVET